MIIYLIIGLIIGLFIKTPINCHGPNSKEICNKIYYDKKTKRKYKLKPKICECT